jgi:hypothetical protein
MQNPTPEHKNRVSLKLELESKGLLDVQLEFGRFEQGTMNFSGRTGNGSILSVCIGIKSAADIEDLDVSLEETIEAFMHHTHLSVELINSDQDTVLLYDSFIDRDALAARVKDMSSYVELAGQQSVDFLDDDHFILFTHHDLKLSAQTSVVVKPTESSANLTITRDTETPSTFEIEISEQTRPLDLYRFCNEAYKSLGYAGEYEKAINTALAVLEYVVSHK